MNGHIFFRIPFLLVLTIACYCHPAIADSSFDEGEVISANTAIAELTDFIGFPYPGINPADIVIPIDTVTSRKAQNFNPEMVYLMDQGSGVYLFRGNMPQMNGFFDYSDLTARITEILAEQHIELPSNYFLLDLSFLHEPDESTAIEIEQDWFLVNPATGGLWANPLRGTLFDPIYIPACVRNLMIEYYDFDGLKTLIPHIRNLMEQAAEREVVIYMHCSLGKDRTGEAAASYLMQYKGYSYADAVALDDKIAGRSVGHIHLNAIRWYAFYLRDFLGITTVGPIEGE